VGIHEKERKSIGAGNGEKEGIIPLCDVGVRMDP
jgi:hypothetical protein